MIKRHIKKIAYVVVCLLLLNSGLSIAAAYSVGTTLDNGTERILVCTSQGYKWIVIDRLSLGGENSSLVDTHNGLTSHDCPFCTFSLYSLDDVVVNPFLSMSFAAHLVEAERLYLVHVSTADRYFPVQHLTRAPPVFI